MRSALLVVALLLGFSASFFTGCPTNTCTAASCPLGCCDTTGRCQTSADQTCGRTGAACASCSGSATCVSGVCMAANTGAGQATGGGAGGGTTEAGYAGFLTNFATEYCQFAIRCGRFPASARSDCAALYRPFFASMGISVTVGNDRITGGTERSVAAGYSSFNANRAQACLTALAALSCNWLEIGPPLECSGITGPAAPSNGACFSEADCDLTLSCKGGTCMRGCSTGGNLGEPCRPEVSGSCAAPFICSNWVCNNAQPLGWPCTVDAECGTGALCTFTRVCARLPAIGSPCINSRCVAEAYCSGSQCVARKMANAACLFSSECAEGLRCTTGQVCGPQGAVGEACTGASGDCAPTLYCNINSQCAVKAAAGAACRSSSDCASPLHCDDVLRTCRADSRVDRGQACTSTQACLDGQCLGKVLVLDGGTNTPGTCRDPQVGDPCTNSFNCGQAQYCDTTTVTCQPAGPGTLCSSDLNCLVGDYCTSNLICAPKAAAGQVCDSTLYGSCAAAGETCERTSTPRVSRCQRQPGVGEACTRTCAFPGACVGNLCVAAGRVGQPCVQNSSLPCIEGECVQPDGGLRRDVSDSSHTCVAPRANGSACVADQGCQSRYCDRLGFSFTGVCAAPCN